MINSIHKSSIPVHRSIGLNYVIIIDVQYNIYYMHTYVYFCMIISEIISLYALQVYA